MYRKDIQGNIIAILDRTGNVVVKYKYDAWGKHKVLDASGNVIIDASHIGNLNPFRYRSYYYDTETKLYFLKTRYYDPEIGRFINMDSIDYADPETINGLNLYAYCNNNPVMNVDPSGNNFFSNIGGWFNNIGKAITDFFVDDVYGRVIKPATDWIVDVAAPAVGNFFTNTVPDFFVNTFWNDWIVDKVWNKGIVVAWDWLANTKAGQITYNSFFLAVSIVGLVCSAIGCASPASPVAIIGLVASIAGVMGSFSSLMMAIFS